MKAQWKDFRCFLYTTGFSRCWGRFIQFPYRSFVIRVWLRLLLILIRKSFKLLRNADFCRNVSLFRKTWIYLEIDFYVSTQAKELVVVLMGLSYDTTRMSLALGRQRRDVYLYCNVNVCTHFEPSLFAALFACSQAFFRIYSYLRCSINGKQSS